MSGKDIILKARQFGVSTACILSQLDECIFNRNFNACILAHEQDAIQKLFRIAKHAYNNLPDLFKPVLARGGGSKYEMIFEEINSKIYCDLESRGDTINWLHISEAAFIREQDRMLSTMQTVPINGIITIETTANGMNHFYDSWMDDNGFKKHFFPWYIYPDYNIPIDRLKLTPEENELKAMVMKKYSLALTDAQINFRRAKIKELKAMFFQEYPEDDQGCFLSTGDAAFDLVIIKGLLDQCHEPIETDGPIEIFKKFNSNLQYIIAADPAEGIGGDSSVAVCFNVNDLEQVAVVRTNSHDPFEFAHLIYKMSNLYHKGGRPYPICAVERNNHGHAVLLELSEHIRYPALYSAKDEKLGWLTDKVTRPIMLDTFIEGVENRTIKINHPETLKECLTLVELNGKVEADEGKHDDCIIACAIATQICIQESTDLYTDIKNKILL